MLTPELAIGIRRVKGVKRLGRRIGNWLSGDQAQILLNSIPQSTLRGRRDAALIGLLGCGLRRSEAVALRLDQIQLREGHWVIADLFGKGGRLRTVPVPDWCKALMDSWLRSSGVTEGLVFRRIRKNRDCRCVSRCPPVLPAAKSRGSDWLQTVLCQSCNRLLWPFPRLWTTLPFFTNQVAELWILVDVVGNDGADDVHFQLLVASVFEGSAGEGSGDSSSAKRRWNFGVPEGNPSLVVALELEPGSFSVLVELEPAFRDFAAIGHDGFRFF